MISFRAAEVSIKREDWGHVITLSADQATDTEHYLGLQAKHSYDEQDVRDGRDDVYIEVCGQGWAWWGNMERFELSRSGIFVQLSEEASAEMEDDGKVEATFSLDEKTYARLRTVLRQIFDGRAYFRDGTV